MRTLLRTFAIALLLPGLANAQELRGAVVLANSQTVVAGVILEARSTSGDSVLARAVTNDRGEFSLRLPAAGTYSVRGLRIGSRPSEFGSYSLAEGELRLVRWELAPTPLVLAEVRVRGRQVCGRRAMAVEEVAAMLGEARKALQLSQLGAAYDTHAEWAIDHQMASLRGEPSGPITSEIHRGLTRQPFASLPADSLARVGYAVADSLGSTFYAPDAHVLLADLFVDSHCFRTVPPRGVDPAWIGLAFEPFDARNDERVLIEGTIWLDRASAELRRLDFRYANLNRWHAAEAAGGQVAFRRISDDLWIVSNWVIRMPSPVGLDGSVRMRADVRGGPVRSTALSLQTVTGAVLRVESDSAVLFAVEDSSRPTTATAATAAAYCPGGLQPGLGVLWGVLRDSLGAPLSGASVDIEWDVGHRWFGESERAWDTRGRTVMTSPLGIWLGCDIPKGVPLTAWGQHAQVSGVPALLEIPRDSMGLEAQLVVGTPPRSASGRTLRGVVLDSLLVPGPVPFADVRVLGSAQRTFADSLGGFQLDSLPPGPVTLVWRDVQFDVLGAPSPSRTVDEGDPEVVALSSVPFTTFAGQICGAGVSPDLGVLIGRVVDSTGAAQSDVVVRARWSRLSLGPDENRPDSVVVRDTTDASGRYTLCGVPRSSTAEVDGDRRLLVDGALSLSARGRELVAGPISVELDGVGVMRRDLVAGSSRTVSVRGRVLDSSGEPVVGAMVSVSGRVDRNPARSSETGDWVLDSVPLHSTELDVRSLGFIPTRIALDPTDGTHDAVELRIERIPQQLEAAVIVGQRRAAILEAFEYRRVTGLGTFLDEATIGATGMSLQVLGTYIRRSDLQGFGLQQRLVFENFSIFASGYCEPLWFVDGVRFGMLPGPEQSNLLAAAKLVEVYRGFDAPAEYMDTNGCGSVLVWTRLT